MNTKTTRLLLLGAVLAGANLNVAAQQLAFPEAQGWGRFATGGRTGSVYHVTNLNDSGTGSLRDAVSQPNRIVIFDVAGVIKINSRIVFSKNLYVAGQTAPGEGIIVYGDGVSFSGADNIIVRHIRFRMGHSGSSGKDAAGIANGKSMIFDHCSFSWGLDEVFSINPDGKGTTPQLITISNSIMGQGLLSHSAGGLMQSDSITLYRNFYCDNSTRNNKMKGCLQYVNNIVYNWSSGCLLMGGDSSGKSWVNATNNLFINGPSGSGNAITSGNSDFNIYAEDNWQDKNRNGIFDPYEIPHSEYGGGPTFAEEPFNYPALKTWKATELVDSLLPTVGANLPYRDMADFYMVHQAKSFGKEGALLSTEEQLPFGAPTSWEVKSFDKPVDSDGDGMPDEWEKANGTDPTKNDAMVIAANGYANIENYINSLTTENRPVFLRTPLFLTTTGSTDKTITLGWSNYTEGEDGLILEQKDGDEYKEVARIDADAEAYTVSGLTAGTAYSFRLRAYKGEAYSEYAELDTKTQPEQVDMVDCDNFVGDDNNWLIAPVADSIVTLTGSVEKEAVVVRTDADVTISGEGSLDGKASLNKTGQGKLSVETENGYTGASVLHDGVFSFATLKNGGEKSALGASVEYGQNWIWDGGVWNYTGASTATNRDAKIYRDTEFNIEKASTVTMNGSIEGEGKVTISGKGTVVPASASFFKYGNTELKDGGTLKLTYVKSLAEKKVYLDEAETSNKLIMSGGNFAVENGGGLELTYWFPIEVTDGTYSTFAINKNAHLRNNVTGTGALEYKIPYVREYLEGDWTKFYGTLVANGVGTEKDGSQLMFQKGFKGMPNTKVYLKGNARLVCWNTNDEQYIGGLSGDKGTYLSASSKNTTNAQMIWHIGGANTDETFNGTIDNKTSAGKDAYTYIVKEGSGIWRLTGTNTFKGSTKVNKGTLVVNGTNSGTGAVTVNADATLRGEGTVAGKVTVISGGTVAAGDTVVNAKVLKLTGGCTVNAGGIVETALLSNATKAVANRIKVTGNFIVNDAVLNLDLTEAETIANDKAFSVFDLSSATVSGSGFKAIEPERPSATQVWDLSELLTTGVIYVRDASYSGINTVKTEKADAPKYRLNGLRVSGNNVKGMYIQNGKKHVAK